MIEIDASLVAILVTILGALIGVAFGYGSLTQKVKGVVEQFKNYQKENKDDHNMINNKLDRIIQNGHGQRVRDGKLD